MPRRSSITVAMDPELPPFDRHGEPVTIGVAVPRGQVNRSDGWSLTDAFGADVPVQTTTLDRWGDGSVRWQLIEFHATCCRRRRGDLRAAAWRHESCGRARRQRRARRREPAGGHGRRPFQRAANRGGAVCRRAGRGLVDSWLVVDRRRRRRRQTLPVRHASRDGRTCRAPSRRASPRRRSAGRRQRPLARRDGAPAFFCRTGHGADRAVRDEPARLRLTPAASGTLAIRVGAAARSLGDRFSKGGKPGSVGLGSIGQSRCSVQRNLRDLPGFERRRAMAPCQPRQSPRRRPDDVPRLSRRCADRLSSRASARARWFRAAPATSG